MTPRDFCYWLMGLIELGRINSLYADQVVVMIRHLRMMNATRYDKNKFFGSECGRAFCDWLFGVLEFHQNGVGTDHFKVIERRLRDVYGNEIDPMFPNGALLQALHDGEPEPDDDRHSHFANMPEDTRRPVPGSHLFGEQDPNLPPGVTAKC